jgi:flavin-dependent dehydrogenase
MSKQLGKQAVVAGAGIGGLAAARADHFDRVIVLETDALPAHAFPRPGTPQSKHLHVLLAGGQKALADLFPGFEEDLREAGAVSLCESSDIRRERPGYDPFPQRDLGMVIYSMSRPLLESVVRKKVGTYRNVELSERCRAKKFVVPSGSELVGAVSCEHNGGQIDEIPADLVVDATGHGLLTLNLLASLGKQAPEETTVGVDMGYASATFEIPDDAPPDWKAMATYPNPPESRGGVYVYPIEGNKWMVTNTGRYSEKPPDDEGGFFAHLQKLRTSTCYNALKHAKRHGAITRHTFKASRRRRFGNQATFPRNLIPFSDTICRFNPIYGQGMSVAALEACLLQRLLVEKASEGKGMDTLASDFIAGAQSFLETPWAMAVIPDFVDPLTDGERPADFEETLKFSSALFRAAAEDSAIQKVLMEVIHLLKPRSVYRELGIEERVHAQMAAAL